MANQKVYTIQINGLTESISAVESLNKQLDALDKKISALSSKSVNVSSGGGSKSSSTSSLSEEEKLEKQIVQLQNKKIANSKEIYQNYIKEKEALKEIDNLQKQAVASERVQANTYSNTMEGIKQKLADLKSVHFTTDISTDEFKKQTQEIDALTKKLKGLEEEYGVYTRNVGNYASAADGFKKFALEVNGTTREFNSAKQALKELKAERDTLSTKKDLGLISEEEVKRLEQLTPIVEKLKSSIQDAGKPMDALLDSMQSLVALTQVSKGFSAFFGIDDGNIDETLKNLVALQNAMQGLQKIEQQLQSEEGFGSIFKKSNDAIDEFTKKLFGVKDSSEKVATAEKAQAAATSTVATASKNAATAEGVQSAANVGLAASSKVATLAARGLSLALKAIGIGFVLEGISLLVEGIKSAATAIADLFRVSEAEQKQFVMSIGAITDSTNELVEVLNQSVSNGLLTKEQALTEQFHLQVEEIKDLRDEMLKLLKARGDLEGSKLSESDYGMKREGWLSKYFEPNVIKHNEEIKKFLDYLDRIKDASEQADNAITDFANGLPNSEAKFKDAQKTVNNLWLELQNDKDIKKVQQDLENFFPDESFRQGANAIISVLKILNIQFGEFGKTVANSKQSLERYLMTDLERSIDDINKEEEEMLKAAGNSMEKQAQVRAKAEEKRKKAREAANKSTISSAKKASKDIESIDRNLTQLELRIMSEGLNKKLRQLEEEKRQTINKIKENGVRVAEQVRIAEERYAQIQLLEINNYLTKLTETVKDSAKKISEIKFNINVKDIELAVNDAEEAIRHMSEDIAPVNNTLTTKFEYDSASGKTISDKLSLANDYLWEKEKTRTKEKITEYYRWLESYAATLSEDVWRQFFYENLETGELEIDYSEVEKYLEEHYKNELDIINSYGYQITSSLSNSFALRLAAQRKYYKDYTSQIDKALEEEYYLREEAANKEYEALYEKNKEEYRITLNTLKKREFDIKQSLDAIEKLNNISNKKLSDKFKKEHKLEIDELVTSSGKKIETYKEYYDVLKMTLEKNLKETQKQITDNEVLTGEKQEQALRDKGQKLIQIENDINERRRQNYQKYYDNQLSNYRDFLSKINSESSKQPVTDTSNWGIVNLVATKRNYREILDATKTMFDNIKSEKERLNQDWKNGLINSENYNATLNQLNDLEAETKQTQEAVENNLKSATGVFFQSIQMYVQELFNSFNQIMTAVWNYQEEGFNDEQEQLDKDNEKIQKLLEEQENMLSKHKSAIDSIEDELANSRGDRRQHLIDQLNAEMEAERRAAAEKKKLEKDEEANKKKQEELEKKRKRAQYKRDQMQAIVNGAMAVTYAAMNSWPIPAIPLMALAASTTAAQLAIMASNKPYAKGGQLDGGVAVGNRHRDGGIKVLGGRAEIEGGEYVTNRLTTAKNLDLLEYVNSKKKRIDIADMLEFYNSGKPRKAIQNVRTKFEDGGYIAPLPTELDIKDQLRDIYIMQDNRPVWVSVVDINNKQADVRRVQTLAGLSE